jgi:hypothetical protein
MDYTTGKGFLTAVTGFTTAAPNGITYWPNGMMHSVFHSNGVTETQLMDASTGMARPAGYQFTGWTAPVACAAATLSGPSDVEVRYGKSTTLVVAASNGGSGALTYQWYRGTAPDASAPVAGATGSSLTLDAVHDTARYWVKVTNTCGSATVTANSRTVKVTVRMDAPTNVAAISTDGTSIRVTWNGVTGATSYTVRRTTGPSSPVTTFTDVSMPFTDTTVEQYRGYLYRVVANRTTAEPSVASGGDLAVAAHYVQTMASNVAIRGQDLSELRRAVDGVRELAGLSRAWASYASPTGMITAADWSSLHARLTEARAAAYSLYGVPPIDLGSPPQQYAPVNHDTPRLLRRGVQ